LLFYPVVGRSCVICYIRNQIHDWWAKTPRI
jgi:hypothetical protein